MIVSKLETKPTLQGKIAKSKLLAVAVAEMAHHYKITANSIGYSEDQLKNWRNDDKDFSDSLDQAKSGFLTKLIGEAKPEFLLERLEPEIFRQNNVADTVQGSKQHPSFTEEELNEALLPRLNNGK